jgi:hypothetical protein
MQFAKKTVGNTMTEYSLVWEEMVWILRLKGRSEKVKAFREKADGIRYIGEIAGKGPAAVTLTITGGRHPEFHRFPVGEVETPKGPGRRRR